MSNFVSALIKQRKDARKAQPDTNGRLREITRHHQRAEL